MEAGLCLSTHSSEPGSAAMPAVPTLVLLAFSLDFDSCCDDSLDFASEGDANLASFSAVGDGLTSALVMESFLALVQRKYNK